jgi:hypothetical protein
LLQQTPHCPQFAVNPRQFAAIPRREQTSPSHPGCGLYPTPLQPCSPSPPHQGGEGGSSVDPSGRSESSATSRHRISPSLGSERGPAVKGNTTVLPANPSLAPRGSTPPSTGRGLGAGGPAGSGPTALRQLPALQNATGLGTSSPSWADMVCNGPRLDTSPPAATASPSASTTADFLALYDRCISRSLRTQINLCNSVGVQEITLTYQIPSSFASAAAVTLVNAARPSVLQRPFARLTNPFGSTHHQSGPSPRRPCHPRPSSRHQCPCRLPRHRPRSGRERPLRGAARSSF